MHRIVIERPDPFLPLIVMGESSSFTIANGTIGHVHPQRQDKDNSKHHRRAFYVEINGHFAEVDAFKIARLVPRTIDADGYTHAQLAGILSEIPAASMLREILKSASI